MSLNKIKDNKIAIYAILIIAFLIPGLVYQCIFHLEQMIEASLLVKIAAIISKSVIFFMISFLYEMIVSGIKIKKDKYSEAVVHKTLFLTSIDIISCFFISLIIIGVLIFFMVLGNEYQYLRILAAYTALHIVMFLFEIVFKKKEDKRNTKQVKSKRSTKKSKKKNKSRK